MGAGEWEGGLREEVEELRQEGLVIVEGERVKLAPGKLAVSNEVFVELMGVVEKEENKARM